MTVVDQFPTADELVRAIATEARALAGLAEPSIGQRLRVIAYSADLVARELALRDASDAVEPEQAGVRDNVRRRLAVDAPGYDE